MTELKLKTCVSNKQEMTSTQTTQLSSKICHADLHNHGSEDDQRMSRPRHDFQNNGDQLRDLINNQLQMLQTDSLNMIERLHELVDEQHE